MKPWNTASQNLTPRGQDSEGNNRIDLVNAFEAVWAYKNKKIDQDELHDIECKACPTAGSCAWLFTANSMACVTECLGMSLPDCACTLAVSPEKKKQAYETGKKIVELTKKNIRARDIMSAEAFEDAIMLDNAIGGSTNVTLHLPAIAKECGITIGLKDFDRISKNTPNICHISPAWPFVMADVDEAGGIKTVMKNLETKLHTDRPTVNWKTVRENLLDIQPVDNDVIRSMEHPYYKEGGVACLVGNICEESVIKQTSVHPDMLVHTWPAKVFYSEQELVDGVESGKIQEGDVVVLPFQWPAGAPWMPEMLTPTAVIKGAGFKKVALITDGRFSWWTAGPCIGHIIPEAYNWGNIGYIQDGDRISIDIPNRSLQVDVSDAVFAQRKKAWTFISQRETTPMMEKFRKQYSV